MTINSAKIESPERWNGPDHSSALPSLSRPMSLLVLIAAFTSGCATWQQPMGDQAWNTAVAPVHAPSQQPHPPRPQNHQNAGEVQNYSDAVVRYQSPGNGQPTAPSNPWAGYGGNYAAPNQQTNGAGYWSQTPGPIGAPTAPARATVPGSTGIPRTTGVQPAQYSQPILTAPSTPGTPPYAATGTQSPAFGSPGYTTAPTAVAPSYGPPSAAIAPPTNVPYDPNAQFAPAGPYNAGAPFNPNAPLQTSPWGQAPFDPNAPNQYGTFQNPQLGVPTPMADIIVNLQETQTGRLMVGAAVNSDAGVTGQIVIDEKNFDWQRVPTSWDDWANGTAFRGAGQGFRIEALPGDEVQRYMFQFTEPYLLDTRVSLNASGFLFNRRFFDWDEERVGGRLGFGYRLGPDLSLSASLRAEEVTISDPRVDTVPQLNAALGRHELYGVRFALTQDTRDIPFAPTQGYFFEASFEQVFGSFDYSRGSVDFKRYFLLTERPDGSGRHVLGFTNKLGITGSDTPIFERYFAGGYSTLRGFDFRGATPKVDDVAVGGELSFLGSIEYLFPITADDMLKGVVFCDYGTIEETLHIDGDDYRVALGAGLRISVPAMGPAPIALDFAVPVAREDTDDIRQFSFFMGLSR